LTPRQEAHPAGTSRLHCDRVLSFILYLCLRYDRTPLLQTEDTRCALFDSCQEFYGNYSSAFHTKNILMQRLETLHKEWNALYASMNRIGKPEQAQTEPKIQQAALQDFVQYHLEQMRYQALHADIVFTALGQPPPVKDYAASPRLAVLHCSIAELSRVTCLRRIVSHTIKITMKVRSSWAIKNDLNSNLQLRERLEDLAHMVATRRAHTRHRKSYMKLWGSLSFFLAMIPTIGVLVESELRSPRLALPERIPLATASDAATSAIVLLQICVEKQEALLRQGDRWEDTIHLFIDTLNKRGFTWH
jgi:hypothetical protein